MSATPRQLADAIVGRARRLDDAGVRGARRVTDGSDAGSATAEMTLIAPLLVVVLLFVVLCGRLVAVQIDVDAAASAAARAASIARTRDAAQRGAERAAADTLSARSASCPNPQIDIAGSFNPGGSVTARVTCHVALEDLALLAVPGSRDVVGEATSPIDQWRGDPR